MIGVVIIIILIIPQNINSIIINFVTVIINFHHIKKDF